MTRMKHKRPTFGNSRKGMPRSLYQKRKKRLRYLQLMRRIRHLRHRPLISVLLPVYNVAGRWLRKCIDSVRVQSYPKWELNIVDDASTKPHIRKILRAYKKKDSRIKVVFRKSRGQIAAATNSALQRARGQYIALLDHDDELTPDALYENVKLINEHPEADMIYSDEDKIDERGALHSAFYKPDWSPDLFLGMMYTCHLGVYRTEWARNIGGFRSEFNGSQDWDFVLRLTEHTKNIFHIPKILYHWRTISSSTAAGGDAKDYAHQASYLAVQEALQRRGENGFVEQLPDSKGHYLIRYAPVGEPRVSIIIATRDKPDLLGPCLQSIFDKTSYPHFEVIVVDNGSVEEETRLLLDKWLSLEPFRVRVMRMDIPYNWSLLNNEAVRATSGEFVLLLNNDIEVITPNWLEEMIGQAARPSIGAVGVKLLYPDQTLQHAGVALGDGTITSHRYYQMPKDNPGYFGMLRVVSNQAAVTGACLMVRKQLFEEVGGLEDTLAVSFNDIDFCLKLHSRGHYNIFLPHVQLIHYESKTRGFADTPEKLRLSRQEEVFLLSRWREILRNDPFQHVNLRRKVDEKFWTDDLDIHTRPSIEAVPPPVQPPVHRVGKKPVRRRKRKPLAKRTHRKRKRPA